MRGAARASVALAVLVATVMSATPEAPAAALTDEVRRRLAANEIVVTDVMPPGASSTARGGTALAVVRASPDRVWRVIVDYANHPRLYPRVSSAEVVETDARRTVVRYGVSVGPFSFSFFMDKYPDPRRRYTHWNLAHGRGHGLFRENSGYWHVEDQATVDTSLVAYAIAVRTAVPGMFTEGTTRASLVETVTALRKLVEPPR